MPELVRSESLRQYLVSEREVFLFVTEFTVLAMAAMPLGKWHADALGRDSSGLSAGIDVLYRDRAVR